ncbi:hypothetical protein PENTCL1PPCAC_3266, partial [Pristionchus entomophagus]
KQSVDSTIVSSVVDSNISERTLVHDSNFPLSTQPLLERLRTHYRSMCHTRLIGELHARGEPALHPLRININDPPTFPATFKSMQSGNQILLASVLEFGNVVFPEFMKLEEQGKWSVVTKFFYRFRTFEGCYRATQIFPKHLIRFLPNFTTYLSPGAYASFYDGFPKTADVEGATRYIKDSNFQVKEIAGARKLIARLKPHNEEFLAVIGLMFWTVDGINVSQAISTIAEQYTKQILN